MMTGIPWLDILSFVQTQQQNAIDNARAVATAAQEAQDRANENARAANEAAHAEAERRSAIVQAEKDRVTAAGEAQLKALGRARQADAIEQAKAAQEAGKKIILSLQEPEKLGLFDFKVDTAPLAIAVCLTALAFLFFRK